ncbi:hypothetical protein M514_00649 [Trichuris suis]|uniref:Uncharacterized protein n=1 Tax=Trichuris suis TaxID=68888 RepID=A0A085N722_9BILA
MKVVAILLIVGAVSCKNHTIQFEPTQNVSELPEMLIRANQLSTYFTKQQYDKGAVEKLGRLEGRCTGKCDQLFNLTRVFVKWTKEKALECMMKCYKKVVIKIEKKYNLDWNYIYNEY